MSEFGHAFFSSLYKFSLNLIGLYRENAIAIQNESSYSNGGNV